MINRDLAGRQTDRLGRALFEKADNSDADKSPKLSLTSRHVPGRILYL